MYSSYQDKYGFIHLHENPTIMDSENGSLFTAASFLLMIMNKTPRDDMRFLDFYKLKKSDTEFYTHADTGVVRCSHDNMTGLHITKALGLHNMELPIIKWDSRGRKYWLHPRDVIFYSYLSNIPFSGLLLPLLLLFSLHSFLRPRQETSGKCLWFYRFGVLTLSERSLARLIGKVGLSMGAWLLKREHGDMAFIGVFRIYFTDPNHPVNHEILKWYGV